jgi:D-ribulokinase
VAASKYVLGVDVGTVSARAGLFDTEGHLVGRGEHAIELHRPAPDFVEQSSDDIWRAVAEAAQEARRTAGVPAASVVAIGFDATCSLVAIDGHGGPVTVSRDGDDRRNVIVWMDHRAIADAEAIDATAHPVLQFVGGSISPEMETPKLRWVKRELPDTWRRVARWFDLPDFLTWRASGADARSLCSTVCKWTYLGHERRWDPSYFASVGLEDLAADRFAKIGASVLSPGENVGGLAATAAEELGLRAGTAVGASLIDAHAGALGMLGAAGDPTRLDRRLAVIAGTSACHLAVSEERFDVPGVWGPYWEALLPGRWLTEAGLSASGAFLDFAMRTHPAFARLPADPYPELERRVDVLATDPTAATMLAAERHWQPNVLGNRAPLADPTLTGGTAGVRMRDDLDDLAAWYVAALQALAYATRHIVDALAMAGRRVDLLVACGGSAGNRSWLQAHADALGMPVAVPAEPDAVLLGAAMLGATAAGIHPSLETAMATMTRIGAVMRPNREVGAYHNAKYAVYRRMIDDHRAYRSMMATSAGSAAAVPGEGRVTPSGGTDHAANKRRRR